MSPGIQTVEGTVSEIYQSGLGFIIVDQTGERVHFDIPIEMNHMMRGVLEGVGVQIASTPSLTKIDSNLLNQFSRLSR